MQEYMKHCFGFPFLISQLGLNPKSYGFKGLSPFYMQKIKIRSDIVNIGGGLPVTQFKVGSR